MAGSRLQQEKSLLAAFEDEGSDRIGLDLLESVERHFGSRLRTCSRWLQLRGGYHR